jgi:hypothetical protein
VLILGVFVAKVATKLNGFVNCVVVKAESLQQKNRVTGWYKKYVEISVTVEKKNFLDSG